MTVLVFIGGGRERAFDASAFPLALGIAGDRRVILGMEAEATALAWILAHRDGLTIQPETSRTRPLFNGVPLAAPAWLRQGDEITLGATTVSVTVDDGVHRLVAAEHSVASGQIDANEAAESPGSAQLDANRRAGSRAGAAAHWYRTPKRIALAVVALLLLGVTFVLAASPVHLRFTPAPDTASIAGFPLAVPVGDRYLVVPGTYDVVAHKEGYRPLRERVSIAFGASPTFSFQLRKLPGHVRITTPPIEGAKILVDGAEKAMSPAIIEVEAGPREIGVAADRYFPEVRRLEVEGMGRTQELEISLRPAWGTVIVRSRPDGATVTLDGTAVGETPATFEALDGAHELALSKPGWKTATRPIEARAAATTEIPTIELERIDGTVVLRSEPAGATVLIDDQFRGRTPIDLALVGDREYRLSLSMAGFEGHARRIRVEGGATERLTARLNPEFGTVFLTTNPPGATLLVNSRPSGSATQRLSLQTTPQVLEIAKDGYEPHKVTVTPQKGLAKRVEVTLKTLGDALKERVGKGIVTPGGQKLALVYVGAPVRFTAGSPRRDAARRSNEVEYPVELTRSFLISEKEVTNAEFRLFKPSHASGSHQGTSLDEPDAPVVNVSWEDAARYANWLSTKEGLTPVYREADGKLIPVLPLPGGYRLPTEAEWEFAARFDGGQRPVGQPLRFAWGDAMPPPANSGNFAHAGSGLPFAIPGYTDAFAASAPVGKFAPSKAQIYDLSGNVAEWCHDFYDIAATNLSTPRKDPPGPSDGRFHVIKGSSWRSGSATELRFAYRDYAEKPRDDLGFRIVRHIDAKR